MISTAAKQGRVVLFRCFEVGPPVNSGLVKDRKTGPIQAIPMKPFPVGQLDSGMSEGHSKRRNAIMKRLFAAVLVVSCAVGSTPGLARGSSGHDAGRGGFERDPTILLGSPAPQMPAFENRIPAPLAPPAQAPIINGPLSQPALRGM
jgi:hypothetical protein